MTATNSFRRNPPKHQSIDTIEKMDPNSLTINNTNQLNQPDIFHTMKLLTYCKLILPLAIIGLVSGCTSIQTVNLDGSINSLKIGARQGTGGAITVNVVTSDDAIFKLNDNVNPPICTFIPPDGTPVNKQAKRVAHDKDATSVLVLKNYGRNVGEIVKANFETRFAQVNLTTSLTPGTADCVIEPHVTFVQTSWGLKSTVSLAGTFTGKQYSAESTSLKETSPYNLIWELPVAVGGYPIGFLIVAAVDSNWTEQNVRSSVSTAWSDSAGKLVGEASP